MTEEALADVKVEGKDPFNDLNKENDTPSDSPAEKEQTKEQVVDEPASGKNTEKIKPFHEDPRWQEMHAKAQKVELLEKEISDLKAFREETNNRFKDTRTPVPDWFKELYGDNELAWQKYSEQSKREREEIKAELRKEQVAEQEAAKAQEEHWNKWVGGEISKLEGSGKKFDKNELIKIMLDTRPTDTNGNLDFEAGYRTYEYRHPKEPEIERSQARKQIADTTSRTSRGEGKVRDYRTPADFKGRGFHIPLP